MLASSSSTSIGDTTVFGGEGEIRTAALAITAGTAIVQHTPMAQITATGVYAPYAPAGVNGTQNAVALSAEAVSATGTSVPAYVSGVFDPTVVVWPVGTTAAQKLTAFNGTMITLTTKKGV